MKLLALRSGNADCVQHLLEAGASVRSENGRGQSALHLAALAQSPETVELLLSKGEITGDTWTWDITATRAVWAEHD